MHESFYEETLSCAYKDLTAVKRETRFQIREGYLHRIWHT